MTKENELELPQIAEASEIEAPKYFGNKPPTTKTALDRAKKEGLKVVYPDANQLQIDIDSVDDFEVFLDHLTNIKGWLKIKSFISQPSLSGEAGHFHITLTCDRHFNAFERIALQALLGSDLKRELLGFIMYKNGESKPTLFLEKKP